MARPTPARGVSSDMRRDELARRLISVRLADVFRHAPHPQSPLEPDAVHDMRTACRRQRAALGLLGQEAPLSRCQRQVKRLQDALGAVRDVHVQAAWLAGVRGRRGLREGLRLLVETVRAPLSQLEATLCDELARWETRTVPALLGRLAEHEDARRVGRRHLTRALRERLRRLKARMAVYQEAPDASHAHALRITVKKLRYEVEVASAVLGQMARVLEVLEPLQESLGELHDSDVRLELLARLASEGPPPGRAVAHALREDVQAARARQCEELARLLQRWHDERRIASMRRLL